ncbi:MAG: type II toxin-antitoxin system VapC family toxin [Chloroflexi bacterium]|nr:type II toxin-antitoxin system VapC family toxin [Chloroflexota bacterium]
MRLLLDTHTFIWWDSNPEKLSSRVLEACQDDENVLVLNIALVWEMQIKLQLGKLKLAMSLADIIDGQRQANNLEILPITLPQIIAHEKLPSHHKDPFDRMLIAQAIVEDVMLLSRDAMFVNYPAKILW